MGSPAHDACQSKPQDSWSPRSQHPESQCEGLSPRAPARYFIYVYRILCCNLPPPPSSCSCLDRSLPRLAVPWSVLALIPSIRVCGLFCWTPYFPNFTASVLVIIICLLCPTQWPIHSFSKYLLGLRYSRLSVRHWWPHRCDDSDSLLLKMNL